MTTPYEAKLRDVVLRRLRSGEGEALVDEEDRTPVCVCVCWYVLGLGLG